MTASWPHSATEDALFASGCQTVAGVDEVGRGAWAGPVAVGVAVVTEMSLLALPPGVRDSKQLSPKAREEIFEPLRSAVSAYGIGYASAPECDALGMTAALRLATKRAFAVVPARPDGVIVDGNMNLTGRKDAVVLVKADCSSLVVAAASILAKVTRDRLMIEHAKTYPAFGFARNKGYASTEHGEALRARGLSDFHRKSWNFAVLRQSEEQGMLADVLGLPGL